MTIKLPFLLSMRREKTTMVDSRWKRRKKKKKHMTMNSHQFNPSTTGKHQTPIEMKMMRTHPTSMIRKRKTTVATRRTERSRATRKTT